MKFFKKYLIIGLIILFVGASIFPSISGIIDNNYILEDWENGIDNKDSQNKKSRTEVFTDVDWWPMFQHDECHTGFSTSEDAPDTKLILWTKDTGGEIRESPVVVNNKVYIGSRSKYLYCLDTLTGEENWSYYMPNDYFLSPSTCAVVNDRVYFMGIHTITCLYANNGSTIWDFPYGGYVMPPFIQTPTVANGRVYFGTGLNNQSGNFILCIDAEGNGDGTTDLLWSFETEDQVDNTPAVNEDKVYAGNTRLYCLDASNGDLIWNTPQEYFYSSPTCYNGRVYIGSNYGLFCYDAIDGTEIWSQLDIGEIWTTPAIAYGNVYAGSFEGNVFCLDADNGNVIWEYPTGGIIYSSPAVAAEKVYIGSCDKYFYCIDALDGDLIWKDNLGEEIRSSPAIADGIVYVGSNDGKVYAYRGGEFSIEIIKPKEGWLYIRDIEIYDLKRILSAVIFGRISVIAKAIDTKYDIENVTFYLTGLEKYKTNISDDGQNFTWFWPAWKRELIPIFVPGELKAKAENRLGQTLESKGVKIFRIGGRGGY